MAIGNPLGLELTVSNGIVSGIRTDEKEEGKLLQITAPSRMVAAAVRCLTWFGEVVGINAMFLEGGESLNFAIPVNNAKNLLQNQSAQLSLCLTSEKMTRDPRNRLRPMRQLVHLLISCRRPTKSMVAVHRRSTRDTGNQHILTT